MLYDKTITFILGVAIFIFFSIFFIIQNYVFDKENKISNTLTRIEEKVKNKNWNDANNYYKKFNKLWHNGKYFIAVNNADQTFTDMDSYIHLLKSTIEVHDINKSVEIINLIKNYWSAMKSIAPIS